MPRAEFEPIIPASEEPQTNALDRATTGIICYSNNTSFFPSVLKQIMFCYKLPVTSFK